MNIDNWSRENLAWLAGLLEGEGSFQFRNGRSLRIQVAMTDEDVVRRAHQVTGGGNVSGPYVRGEYKPQWLFTVTRSLDAYALMVALLPWMGARRRRDMTRLISEWTQWQQVGRVEAYRQIAAKNRKVTDEVRARIMREYNGVRWRHGQAAALALELGVSTSTVRTIVREAKGDLV